MNSHDPRLTRHGHSTSTKAVVLASDHPAMVEMRPLFKRSANEGKRHKARVLVRGFNSRKIGDKVTKGDLVGFSVYTLTLTERATCPSDCSMLASCYGNRSPWSLRWPAGPETEDRIERELAELQDRHPAGFLLRLHILGDFYSVEYVRKWEGWLERFPALHVFGFTARHHDDIAAAIAGLAAKDWKRFAVRSSEGKQPGMAISKVVERGAAVGGIVCPAQLHKTAACASCSLCWSAPSKTILFHPH